MDLEKIEIRKKIFKSSGFCNSKTLNFYKNVIHIFSSLSRLQAELLTIRGWGGVLKKNGGAKDFDFKQKN